MLKKTKIILAALLGALSISTAALAGVIVTNTATGTISGNGGSLSDGVLNLDKESMALKKIAFDLAGTRIADGAIVATGQIVWVIIYTDNFTPNQVDDVRSSDTPGAAFTVIDAGALNDVIEVKTYFCNTAPGCPAPVTGWLTAAGVAPYANWTALTDAEGDDIAGYNTGTKTITIGTPANAQFNLTKELRYAFRFKTRIN